jgi:hypothetical protein
MFNWKKIFLFTLVSLVALFLLLAIFISPIARYLIERYSEQYTGRLINMDYLRINLFNGDINVKGLRIHEKSKKQVFVGVGEIDARVGLWRLLYSNYLIKRLTIDQPVVQIVQRGNHFNYDDLVQRFAAGPPPPKGTPPTQYWLRNLQIKGGTLIYRNNQPPVVVQLNQTEVKLRDIAWNDPTYEATISTRLKSGGTGNCLLNFNSSNSDYYLSGNVEDLNIAWMYPYLRDYMKVNSLKGIVSTHFRLKGNADRPLDIALSGDLDAKKFAIVDESGELLTAAEQIAVKVDTIHTRNNRYDFGYINMQRPFIRLTMYDKGFNYERIFTTPSQVRGDTSSLVYSNLFLMMAGYIQDLVQQYDRNEYKVNKLSISGGQCIFTDYTRGDRFRYILDSVLLTSERINSQNDFLNFSISSRLNTSGKLKGTLKVNPKDYRDIIIDAGFWDLLITDFNPYFKYYVATPFQRGKIRYENVTSIINNQLDSKNLLYVERVKTGKKVKNSTAMNLPVPLAVALLRDVKGNIKLDIPVKGNLDDPKFKWGKVVWQVVKNIIVKAATAPFRLVANLFGGKEEDFKEVYFDYVQLGIEAKQKRVLDNLCKVLQQKQEMNMELIQETNLEDEAAVIAVNETKKKYLKMSPGGSLSAEIKQRLDSLPETDTLFVKYVNSLVTGQLDLHSTEEKCMRIIGKETLSRQVSEVMQRRNAAVAAYLQEKQLPATRYKIRNAQPDMQLQRSAPPKYIIQLGTE